MNKCHYCGPTDRETRPYGPEGAGVCYPCMKADPEREAAAAQRFTTLLDAAATVNGGVVVLGGERGPA